jgi:hypothetical protein
MEIALRHLGVAAIALFTTYTSAMVFTLLARLAESPATGRMHTVMLTHKLCAVIMTMMAIVAPFFSPLFVRVTFRTLGTNPAFATLTETQ